MRYAVIYRVADRERRTLLEATDAAAAVDAIQAALAAAQSAPRFELLSVRPVDDRAPLRSREFGAPAPG